MLKFFREKAGLSAEALADAAGTTRQQIYRLEADKRTLTPKWAARLAPHLGANEVELIFGKSANQSNLLQDQTGYELTRAPIIGEVAAGSWIESGDVFYDEPAGFGYAAKDPRYPESAYFSLRVKGDSINRIAADGSYLICVDINKASIQPQPSDVVIVQRTRQQGSLIETTAKVLKVRDNVWELWPDSTNPKHQEPIFLSEGDAENGDEVRIIAVATGSFQMFNHRLLRS